MAYMDGKKAERGHYWFMFLAGLLTGWVSVAFVKMLFNLLIMAR